MNHTTAEDRVRDLFEYPVGDLDDCDRAASAKLLVNMMNEHANAQAAAATADLVWERDEARAEVERLRGIMRKSATQLRANSQTGDEYHFVLLREIDAALVGSDPSDPAPSPSPEPSSPLRSAGTKREEASSPAEQSGTGGTPNEVSSLRLALLAQVAALEGELRCARSGDPSRRFVRSSRREDAKRKQRDLVSLVVKSIQEYGPSAKVAILKSPSGDAQFGDPLLTQVSIVSRVHSAAEVACDLLKVLQEQADAAESALVRAREALSYYLSVFRDGTQRDLLACLDDRGTVAELGLTSVREVLHQQIAAARVLGEV